MCFAYADPLGARFWTTLKIEYAAVAQSVERVLGKDEVTSSNLVKSSTETRLFSGFLAFLPAPFRNANVP